MDSRRERVAAVASTAVLAGAVGGAVVMASMVIGEDVHDILATGRLAVAVCRHTWTVLRKRRAGQGQAGAGPSPSGPTV